MGKTKTTFTGQNVVDFINTYVDNEQKKTGQFSSFKVNARLV